MTHWTGHMPSDRLEARRPTEDQTSRTARKLYFISGSPPCWTVMLALTVKGLAYEAKRLNNAKREQKAPGFLVINPRGQVPVLVEGDFVVCETHAILAYLDATHAAPPLFGQSALETARIWQAIGECEHALKGPVGDISRPLFRGKAEESAVQIAQAAEKVRAELALYEARLAFAPFLAGRTLSAADLVVYPVLMQLGRAAAREQAQGFDLAWPLSDNLPNVARWAARIEALPGYADAYPPHWKE